QDRIFTAVRAVGSLPDDVYWALRIALCRRQTDLPIFEKVYWGLADADQRSTAIAGGTAEAGNDGPGETSGTGDEKQVEGAGSAGDLTVRDYEQLTEVERDQIRTWIAELAFRSPRHRVMRHEVSRTGRVDVPQTMRLLVRNHGELSAIRFHRRAVRPRRVLIL